MSTAIASQSQPTKAEQPIAIKALESILAAKYHLSREVFLETVITMCFPPNARPTNGELMSFLLVCKEQDLNPILREIYAFPKKGGGIQVIVGVDGWLKIANRHPAFDGMTFQDACDADGNVLAIKATIYRKDRSQPIEAIEYLAECKRGTDPWRQMPLRMLRNRAICQAVRIAFGVSGVMNQDEFERWQELTVLASRPHERRVGRSALTDRLLPHASNIPISAPPVEAAVSDLQDESYQGEPTEEASQEPSEFILTEAEAEFATCKSKTDCIDVASRLTARFPHAEAEIHRLKSEAADRISASRGARSNASQKSLMETHEQA